MTEQAGTFVTEPGDMDAEDETAAVRVASRSGESPGTETLGLLEDRDAASTEPTTNTNPTPRESVENEDVCGDGDDSGTDELSSGDTPGTHLQRAERCGNGNLPDVFQTSHLVFYERFKAYQDYMLGDCKTSEIQAFTSDYLEKVVEPSDWQALWCSDAFDVLVEVVDVDYKDLRAKVELVLPLQCETRGCELTEESMMALLEATRNHLPLQELCVVYDESGDLDQTALALEHLRFFYKHIWRKWDEEDEDDEFDYFVRCVEPRLRLYYDILEDRVPAGLVAEYHSVLERCSHTFRQFNSLRNGLSSDSESELDSVSMVEGLRMCEQMEALKRKLRIIENPLLRYVLGYKTNGGQPLCSTKGERPSGLKLVHVVSASTSVHVLHSLMTEKLLPLYSSKEFEVQFHSDPSLAISSCYEGDVVLLCPGHYTVTSSISIADAIQVEGYGLPDEVVIEKRNKGDTFVESTGRDVKISNVKFIQHDAIEGILCVRQGKLELENCVLQCETTGVVVRTTAELLMNMCDLYGSKGAGVEIYPGSVCVLTGNGIHHCKDGVLIKDFADELDILPKITMVNNVIHNNSGYGVILVQPDGGAVEQPPAVPQNPADAEGEMKQDQSEGGAVDGEGGALKEEAETNCDLPIITVEEEPPEEGQWGTVPSEFTEGNDVIKQELVATSVRKHQLQRRRMKELGAVQVDEGLLSQLMFLSIHGNQFRRNGMGSFGTFLY
ncbi:SHC SH2 domain-binding protein 1 [Brachyhypopomus gauderio]|uniref:SHC SH2 domain-binding protein 1 n=1 Tax=Brachyhypopomus gauderio TaxID=698409 RepID=UPI004041A30A